MFESEREGNINCEVREIVLSDDDEEMEVSEATAARNCHQTDRLPTKLYRAYWYGYDRFMEWRKENGLQHFSEGVFLEHFRNLSKKNKGSTLWKIYFMFRAVMLTNHNVDITKYPSLITFLRQINKGSVKKKFTMKRFSADQVYHFLDNAPNQHYLVAKVCIQQPIIIFLTLFL